jgi:hypothetical protein
MLSAAYNKNLFGNTAKQTPQTAAPTGTPNATFKPDPLMSNNPQAQESEAPFQGQQAKPLSSLQGVFGNTQSVPQAKPQSQYQVPNYGSPDWYTSYNNIHNLGGYGAYNEFGSMNPIINLLKALGVYQFPLAAQQATFAGGLEPQREQAISSYLNWASPASQQAQVNQFGNQARQNANVGAEESGALQRASGLGSGYQAGNDQAAGQAASQARNQYQQQVMSPEYQQQLLQSLLGGLQAGQSMPAQQSLLSLENPFLQQEQLTLGSQSQNPFGGALGSILGGLAGGGSLSGLLGGLLGGGGGGSLGLNSNFDGASGVY